MMIKLTWLFFLLLSIIPPIASAKNLSSIETETTRYITNHQEDQLSLLEKLVNINSGTPNITGVHQIGEILRPRFEQLGFKTFWVDPRHMKRAGTLIAEHEGRSGKRILLIGHLDTVFPSNSRFRHFSRRKNSATGPGIIDDKGGDVVILYALKALHAEHALEDANITVILTGDEEDSGKPTSISRKPLIEAARHSDIALDFEWALTLDTATTARRGIINWTLETQGKGAHSSEIFQKKAGDGAIYELVRILNAMRMQLAGEQYLTFSPGLILGGNVINYDHTSYEGRAFGKSNIIAKTAIAKGDLRFLTSDQKVNAQNTITNIVNQHSPGTTATITFEDGIPAMPPTPANLALLKSYSEVSENLGYGSVQALDPRVRGAGDISHIASIVGASLAGLGPVGSGAHSDKETLDIHSLTIQTQRAALLIYQLTHVK